MGKILCFGEILLRFSPTPQGQWLNENQLAVFLGGAELNVASALANWNLPVSFCTSMPQNHLSGDLVSVLKKRKVSTDTILFSGDRIGSYYLTQGTDLKNQSVIYDRAYSAFWDLKPGMINWDEVLHDVSWFHFSAISPALNDSVAAVCLEALQAASRKNILISVDLNHRPKLWKQRNPHEWMSKLLEYCDVVMGNIWSAHDLLAIPLDPILIQSGERPFFLQHAQQTILKLLKRFARIKTAALTFRFESGERGIQYYATMYSAHHWAESPVYESDEILDKVGTGDCFMAGLIFGLYHHLPEKEIIQFASAAGFGKFFEQGDSTQQSLEQIQDRIKQYAQTR